MTFAQVLARDAGLVQARLDAALAGAADVPVTHAMRYAVQGGKRIRAFLVMEGARLHGLSEDCAIHAAAAIEALHAYSLIHDDLPCMDDDDLRRGLPTVHVKWDEATAVLAGDALQTLAFGLLCNPRIGSAEVQLALIARLATQAGIGGMVLGQAQDIAAETALAPLTLDQITELQMNKTCALIAWSAASGAVMAGADDAPLSQYGARIGLAFQIADDILDATGDAALTGKRVGKDADAGKATFVSLMGLDGARAHAARLTDEAMDALAPYGARADVLKQAARYIIARDR
jgi:farnesyl diphosphate synthase